MMQAKTQDPFLKTTQQAYVMTRVLETPFWGVFNLIPFILYKDLNASPFEIAFLITLKPLISIFSSYWSHHIQERDLASSIQRTRWLAFLPFLAIPFFPNTWYLIGCFGAFMFLQVAMIPSWMELLKQNIPPVTREKVVSYTQAFGYLGGGLLPFAIGWILDSSPGAWHWIFPACACIGLTATFWQQTHKTAANSPPVNKPKGQPLFQPLFQPWTTSFQILKHRPDFAHFQIGFMLLGAGLMIIQPALPVFFVDQLHLSYTEMGVAITLCKGIGFATSSPLWVKWIHKMHLFRLVALVAALAALFPLLLILTQTHLLWLYGAYLIYGCMQSGSELSWNLSGPLFAKSEDSSPYSNINVIAVGIRGICIPALGAFCLSSFGATAVIAISCALCLAAMSRMMLYSSQQRYSQESAQL